MTRFQFVVLIAGLVWLGLIAVALRWMGAAAHAGDRFDQVMADHYRANDEAAQRLADRHHRDNNEPEDDQ